jgi:integrase
MPRYARPLSSRRVQSLKARGFYCDGGGLYLQVSPAGTKSWVFRYAIAGRMRHMGLGSLTTFTLAEARERARKMRQLVADGIDPIDQRNKTRGAAVTALSFRQCAERYVAAHEASWKNGSKAWLASLDNHAPQLLDAPVSAIDLALVLQAIEPIWTAKPVTANNVRNRVEMVLDWAKTRGLRHGENPARWKGHLENLLPSRKKVAPVVHQAALPYREVGAFMVDLKALTDTSARVLEFQILTAARSGEVVGARWDEIDMDERVWTIPGLRMKAGKDHRVPLSAAAIAVLERQAELRENQFVFPGRLAGQAINIDAPMRAIEKLRLRGKVTAHGFRSAFRDWAAEQTHFPREVAEASLAHATGDATERAYQRSDFLMKRRQIMESWARYIATPAAKAAEVVSLRARAKLSP